MGSRNINNLCPEAKEKYFEFDVQMKKKGIPYIVTSVDRTIIEQMALFVQGRLPLDQVNNFRINAGLPIIGNKDNSYKVTWTLNSKHVTNMFDTDLNNDYARAFDFAIVKNNEPVWDLKVNVNQNEIPDYKEAGLIWESLGGTSGMRFSNPDYPHLQI